MVMMVVLVAGFGRRLVLWGRGGSRVFLLAPVLVLFPFITPRANGRIPFVRGLARGATVLVVVPIVGVFGTLGVGGRRRSIMRASVRQATVFVFPPEMVLVALLLGHDEGHEGGKNENRLEKHD